MENKDIELILTKYQERKASDAEKALLESWFLSPDLDAISELGPEAFGKNLLLMGEGLPLQGVVRKISWWPKVAAVAAALALFFMAYLERPLIHNGHHPVILTALTAPSGQPKQLTLADGSTVWVNRGSELKYPKSFDNKIREVYLSGEAYFDIRHDATKPFIIHTGNVITTVMGTAFDIKEDKTNHTIEVTVSRGKVSVANGRKLLGIITSNQQISFNTSNEKTTLQKIDAAQVAAWQKVDLKFEDVTFAEAAKRLENRFRVKISFGNDKIKNCRFTGASLTGDRLEKVLKAICDFNNATYQTQPDGSIVINGPGCTN